MKRSKGKITGDGPRGREAGKEAQMQELLDEVTEAETAEHEELKEDLEQLRELRI